MRFRPALDITSQRDDWDLIQAALMDFDVAAIDDNAADVWRVFFHTPNDRRQAATSLHRQFPGCSLASVDVPDEDWAARSQASLRAVRVGNIIVAPPWDIAGGAHATTVVIQPSMGFGTGHHATTRLCLNHLQKLELRNHTAVDIGTGSGVLAIAASRLGATHVLAIDDDPDAIESAKENVALNPGVDVTLGVLDLRQAVLRGFDIVLANLTGGLLVAAARSIQALAAPGGRLVLSGFVEGDEDDVLAAFAPADIDHRSQEEEWVCVTLRSR